MRAKSHSQPEIIIDRQLLLNCSSAIFDGGTTQTQKRMPYHGENFQALSKEEIRKFHLLTSTWRCLPNSPCIYQPRADAISFYKLLERLIVRTPEDRGRLRRYLGNFTQTPAGLPFRELYTKHLNMLRWPTVSSGRADPNTALARLAVIGNDKRYYHYLMPAFYRLLSWLMRTKRQFAILLRTYGRDGPHISKAVEMFLNNRHPTEKPPKDESNSMKVNPTSWKLKRDKNEPKYTMFEDCTENSTSIKGPREIYDTWSSWNGMVTVVDDFAYWQAHNYNHSASKPVWFDPKDTQVQHILFDDNIRFENDGTNGIDLLRLDGSSECVRLTQEEALKWEEVYFVQADLLRIIQDPDYFVKKVKSCEKQLDDIQAELIHGKRNKQ